MQTFCAKAQSRAVETSTIEKNRRGWKPQRGGYRVMRTAMVARNIFHRRRDESAAAFVILPVKWIRTPQKTLVGAAFCLFHPGEKRAHAPPVRQLNSARTSNPLPAAPFSPSSPESSANTACCNAIAKGNWEDSDRHSSSVPPCLRISLRRRRVGSS